MLPEGGPVYCGQLVSLGQSTSQQSALTHLGLHLICAANTVWSATSDITMYWLLTNICIMWLSRKDHLIYWLPTVKLPSNGSNSAMTHSCTGFFHYTELYCSMYYNVKAQRQCCSNSSSSIAEDWKFNQNIYYPYKVAYSKLASSFSVAILVMTFILHILHLHLEQQLLPLCLVVTCAWNVWCTSREKGGQ